MDKPMVLEKRFTIFGFPPLCEFFLDGVLAKLEIVGNLNGKTGINHQNWEADR